MKPRLRPHVQVTRQRYRGRRWHVVHDPASNQFYRLNPIAYAFVGSLDGGRTVEEAWKLSLTVYGDAAPTQNEIIQLLSQLYSANLLALDTTPETEQLLRRGKERLKRKITQQAIGIMYFRIKLFNPDRILTALEPIFRPVVNKWGLLLWMVFVGFALYTIIPHARSLFDRFESAMSPSNWGWLIVVFVVTKAWHELGHGVICKRYGGQVPEMGIMLLVLFPAPYVDASSCWAFPSKWRRMAVGAGGMLFELFAASIAALVWVGAEEGSLVRQIAYNAMITASISTVLFNANPLMRFDGYYILADLLEVPNLAQRSNKMLQYLMQKHVYRLERVTPPTTLRGEAVTLVVYGVLALAYRVFLFISITLMVMGKFFAIGAALAVWTATAWFVIPVGMFIHWLAASPQLSEKRLRAVATSAALAGLVVMLLGVVPFPDRRRAPGVIESMHRSGVYFGSEGFVSECHARPGDAVVRGDPIVTLVSPDLEARRRAIEAELDEASLDERAARAKGQPAAAQIAGERVAVLRGNLEETHKRIEMLVVRSPQDGVVVGSDPALAMGAFVKRGDRVCEVVDPSRVRIAASLDQNQGSWVYGLDPSGYTVRVRSLSVREPDRVMEGRMIGILPAGLTLLPEASLGFAGGGEVETEAGDQSGRVAKRNRFTVHIEPALPMGEGETAVDGRWVGPPGERVKVRFTLPSRPLAWQWLDRLRRTIPERVKI